MPPSCFCWPWINYLAPLCEDSLRALAAEDLHSIVINCSPKCPHHRFIHLDQDRLPKECG